MKRNQTLVFTTVALMLATTAGAQERFTLTGQDVSVYNLAGALRIVAGTAGSTEVEVTRVGRDSRDLRINTDSPSSLRVIYPRDEITYPGMGRGSQSTFSVSDDGTFGDTPNGRSVRITSSDRAAPGAMEAGADIVIRLQPGAKLTARTAIGDTQIQNVSGTLTIGNMAGDITSTGTRGDLTLRTASGKIEVTDAEGTVTLRTASGGVDVENARGAAVTVKVASGRINARDLRATAVELVTASGGIRADGVESDRLHLSSASGGITARQVTAPDAEARTASGSLELELRGPVRSAQMRSASGSVRLLLPPGSNVALELRSSSGSVQLDAPAQIVETRRGYTSATLGDGSGRVSATSASGSVRVSAR